ncbi:TIGR00268 family protein [Candidatus Poribacteria bacterium]|nr:TIGR00268 family protein [Candidatus Poribacteria bacterium]
MTLSAELTKKYAALKQQIAELGEMLVAFSGGVDSVLLAKVAYDVVGDSALAVTAVSESYPGRELRDAKELSAEIGIPLRIVRAHELEDENYARNAPNRCYFCKTELFTQLRAVSEDTGIRKVVYGANLDDTGDYRPGMQAADEWGVYAPLLDAKLTKEDIRVLSRELGLRTWDKPAFACLSSRFPHGTRITPDKLAQVDAAEDLLYDLGFRQFRVRHHEDAAQNWSVARIEVPAEEMHRFFEGDTRDRVVEEFRGLGYGFVSLDLRGYKPGSLNPDLLTIESLAPPSRPSAG